jgi:hypothetical protein
LAVLAPILVPAAEAVDVPAPVSDDVLKDEPVLESCEVAVAVDVDAAAEIATADD